MDFSIAFDQLNWWAVIVATIVSMVWGSAYYSQSMAGKRWMKAAGVKEKDMKEGANANMMATMAVLSFIAALVLGLVLYQVDGIFDGITSGAVIGAGLVVTTMVTHYMYEKRPDDLMMINSIFVIVNFALVGAVFGWLNSVG